MPRKRRQGKARREPLGAAMRRLLETGALPDRAENPEEGWLAVLQMVAALFHGSARALEVWTEYGEEILESWTEENPGTRPYVWWACAAQEPRRVLADPSGRVVKPLKPGDWEHVWRTRFGVPFHGHVKRLEDRPIVVESEATYLMRRGLLTPSEQARLGPDDFEPVGLATSGCIAPRPEALEVMDGIRETGEQEDVTDAD